MFLALVGPDGAGKTSVAAALERAAAAPGRSFWYVHWIPSSERPPTDHVALSGAVPPKRQPIARPSVLDIALSGLRLSRNLARFWIGYLRLVRPLNPRDRDVLVVADRWIYNYLGQPHSVAYHGPHWFARLLVSAAPRPDRIAVLWAAPELVATRKSELSVAEIEAEIQRWKSLSAKWWPAEHFETTDTPDVVASRVLDWAETGDRP